MANYVVWHGLSESVMDGEDGEGWPTYAAAYAAHGNCGDVAYITDAGRMIFGRHRIESAIAADARAEREQAEYAARRAATLASFAAPVVAPVALSADERRAKMLAGCLAALATEQAKGRRADKSEVARLAANIERLMAQEVA